MVTTEYLLERKAFLEKRIRALERELTHLPKDKLICYMKGKYATWYKDCAIDGNTIREYLPKSKKEEARILAKKTYVYRICNDMKNELYAIEGYLKRIGPDQHSKMISADSPYRELLTNFDSWEHEPYPKSTDHPEHLIVPAPKGEFVRSKSEAAIARILHENNIQYRYEYIHNLGGYDIASDFTIIHPRTFKEYVWEHFGLSDSENYIDNNIMFKLPLYLKEGYVPGYNFIMTFETLQHPLGYKDIERIVKETFLDD